MKRNSKIVSEDTAEEGKYVMRTYFSNNIFLVKNNILAKIN